MIPESIKIDEVEYTRKDNTEERARALSGKPYVICRTQSAGVFAGYLTRKEGEEVTLIHARRLWFWSGAASLSQAAEEGFLRPESCKFPQEVACVELRAWIELLSCSERARKNIASIPVWKS